MVSCFRTGRKKRKMKTTSNGDREEAGEFPALAEGKKEGRIITAGATRTRKKGWRAFRKLSEREREREEKAKRQETRYSNRFSLNDKKEKRFHLRGAGTPLFKGGDPQQEKRLPFRRKRGGKYNLALFNPELDEKEEKGIDEKKTVSLRRGEGEQMPRRERGRSRTRPGLRSEEKNKRGHGKWSREEEVAFRLVKVGGDAQGGGNLDKRTEIYTGGGDAGSGEAQRREKKGFSNLEKKVKTFCSSGKIVRVHYLKGGLMHAEGAWTLLPKKKVKKG